MQVGIRFVKSSDNDPPCMTPFVLYLFVKDIVTDGMTTVTIDGSCLWGDITIRKTHVQLLRSIQASIIIGEGLRVV